MANSSERYEVLAELYHRDTGCVAPGKDSPAAAIDAVSQVENEEKWVQWLATTAWRSVLNDLVEARFARGEWRESDNH